MKNGVVKFYNEAKGFGFIKEDNGTEIFVHATGLEEEIREVRAELTSARTGPLEKEQQLLQARAELAETKAQLAKAKGEAQVLAVGMKKKEDEVVRVRAQMAAEVSDAAHQVQELLAAQARAEAAEERAAELARRLRPVSLGGA